jgi:hypothetical protein
MKQFKVFKHPIGTIEAVKQGWSWPGFFFSFIWALLKRMWGISLSYIAGFLILGMIIAAVGGTSEDENFGNLIGLIVAIIFGVNGNSWRETNLKSRGFDEVDTLTAANPEGAIALHLKAVSEEKKSDV